MQESGTRRNTGMDVGGKSHSLLLFCRRAPSLSSRSGIPWTAPHRGPSGAITDAKRRTEYTGMSVRSTITAVFDRVAREQQRTLVPLTDDLKLLGSGLDSLSFAIIVASLEDELGFDPFNSDAMVEFPITFGDFVRLYETPPR